MNYLLDADHISFLQRLSGKEFTELMNKTIARTQTRIPALSRSIEEVKQEWNLPSAPRTKVMGLHASNFS